MENIGSRRDKEKIVKMCNDIQESNHAMKDVIQLDINGYQNSHPWLLTEQQSNFVK